MSVAVPEMKLVGVVELLATLADLCRAEGRSISAALARFMGTGAYGAEELRDEVLEAADYLARALGFPDAGMDPDQPRAEQ